MPRHTSPSFFLAAIITSSALLTVVVMTGLKAVPGWSMPVWGLPNGGMEARGPWAGRADDPWRLRPSDHGARLAPVPVGTHLQLAAEIPDDRRVVRVVYPGLTGSR